MRTASRQVTEGNPMTPEDHVDLILNDCFFAVGQVVHARKCIDYEGIVWLRNRYQEKFLRTITSVEDAWPGDRDRLMAVSRYLGIRAGHYAGHDGAIDASCLMQASAEVEAGCRMQAATKRAAADDVTRIASQAATGEGSS